MLFNSLSFILLFLPVALAGYYVVGLAGNRWAAAWLVAMSLLFYSWWQSALLVLLCGSILFNFTCGFLILRQSKRPGLQGGLLLFGVAANLLLLCYYKYLFPSLNWLGFHGLITLEHPYHILLPLGISFFTFTQIGYLVDCRGGIVKKTDFLDYALFVTFFPHLIAGPILHHREMIPQFAEAKTYRFQWENIAVGLTLFLIGLGKKVLIADSLITNVNDTFSKSYALFMVDAWQGVLSYSLQLYFDFSGYSDMAIGLGRMFGIRFPANFDSPYRAASIIDFWQRWHMTLTRYLTLYLYTPIGLWVSRRRAARGKSISRQAIASGGGFLSVIVLPTFFVMALAGIWHGAGLQFLVFGLLHALYLTLNHAYRIFGTRVEARLNGALKGFAVIWKIGLTYLAVLIAQVFFRASSVHDAVRLLEAMCGVFGTYDHASAPLHFFPPDDQSLKQFGTPLELAAMYFIVWFMPNGLQILSPFEPSLSKIRADSPLRFAWQPSLAWSIALGCLAAVALLATAGLTEFIYFRF